MSTHSQSNLTPSSSFKCLKYWSNLLTLVSPILYLDQTMATPFRRPPPIATPSTSSTSRGATSSPCSPSRRRTRRSGCRQFGKRWTMGTPTRGWSRATRPWCIHSRPTIRFRAVFVANFSRACFTRYYISERIGLCSEIVKLMSAGNVDLYWYYN